MIGQMIAHYKITAKLGEGGMGEVYLATDTHLDRKVAVKILSTDRAGDPDARHRFLHEAKAQAMLSHPNIATFLDVGDADGHAFLVIEYVDGKPLSKIAKDEKLSIPEILDLVIQVGEGLQAAHEHGIVHRDIKPENILVTSKHQVKITDFGLARWKGATTLTKDGTRMGTAYYMSPEQAEGKRVDHRSDLFSLGVILYELVCQRRPFEGETETAIVYAVVSETPHPLARYCANVPDELQYIVGKCLAKSVQERFQSAADLIADLRHVAKMDMGLGRTVLRHRKMSTRRRVTLVVATTLLITTLLSLWIPSVREDVLRWLRPGYLQNQEHIALLPFSTIGSGPVDQTFSNGLLETLTSKVTQLEQFQGALMVIPASEIREERITSAGQARRAFGVTLAVTGSVQRHAQGIRLTMNLVDAKKEHQLRSLVIDNASDDVAAFQDAAVISLADLLEVQLRPEDRRFLTAGGTPVPAAYEGYLRGLAQTRLDNTAENIGSAIGSFRDAISQDPHFAMAHAALGEAYRQMYEATKNNVWVDHALESCSRAIALNDRYAPVYVTLGFLRNNTGRNEEAVGEFAHAIRLDPANRQAYRGLGSAFEELRRTDQAEAIYHQLIESRPNDWVGYRDLQLFYLRLGRTEDALMYLDKVVALIPEGFRALNDIGAICYLSNRREDARRLWAQSIRIAPNYAAYSNLGALHYSDHAYAEAAGMYKRALNLDDHDYQVWINLASSYYWIPDDREKSLATYEHAAKMAEGDRQMNPKNPFVLSHLAECYAFLGNRGRSLSLIKDALALAPDNIEFMLRAGIVYEILGERDTALNWVEAAVDRGFPLDQIEPLPELAQLRADSRFLQIRDASDSTTSKPENSGPH